MSIKDLPHATVEQVLVLRKAAIELEKELEITSQARTAYRIALENLEASLPKIKADAVRAFDIPELDSVGDERVVSDALNEHANKLEAGE